MGTVDYRFAAYNHYKTIDSFLDKRKDFIVLGLCGKTGSGASTAARILQQDFASLNLPYPGDELGDDLEGHEYKILYRYAQKHWLPFFGLKSSALITAHILSAGEDKFKQFLTDLFSSAAKGTSIDEDVEGFFSRGMRFSVWDEVELDSGVALNTLKWFTDDADSTNIKAGTATPKGRRMISGDENLESVSGNAGASTFKISVDGEEIVGVLISEGIVEFDIKELYKLYMAYIKRRERKSGFNNPLWICILKKFIYDFLPKETHRLWHGLSSQVQGLNIMAQQQLGINMRICGKPYFEPGGGAAADGVGREFDPEAYLSIVEEINHCIKLLVAYLTWRKGLNKGKNDDMRSLVVVDSIKNPYESMYLKSRYTNYYLLGIYTEDIARENRLLKGLGIAAKFVKSIDIIEQQSEFKKLWKERAEKSKQSQDGCQGDKPPAEEFKPHQGVCGEGKGPGSDIDIVDKAMSTIDKGDLYDEIPFILQNVESCLQDADIFINNERDNENRLLLKKKLVRYVSLIMNPGLVLPTPVERCMQFAYTAKLNSGCISRQVGAAITDADYHLLAIGWNQQPEGQLPCSYRDLCSLHYKWSKESYSEYECDDTEAIQERIKAPVTDLLSKPECPLNEKGKLPAFCFKDLYNSITGSNNQVHPRSLHAEETAFLNLKQFDCTGGILFTTSSPCELCSKKARYMGIKTIYYIEPYAGLSFSHVLKIGAISTQPKLLLFSGAVGRAYTQLYTPLMPQKDEIAFWLGAKLDAKILGALAKKQTLAERQLDCPNSELNPGTGVSSRVGLPGEEQ